MQAFTNLYLELDQSTSTLHKIRVLADYLKHAEKSDAAWAVFLLAGGKLRQSVPSKVLRTSATSLAGLPDWLFEECYQSVGDLAETIALVLGTNSVKSTGSLSEWMKRIESCRGLPDIQLTQRLHEYWQQLDGSNRLVMNKLITGGFRVGVSRLLVTRAVALAYAIDEKIVAQRLMGYLASQSRPSAEGIDQILGIVQGEENSAHPYPFFLAHPWIHSGTPPGPIEAWQLEWKWDGIRCQLVFRNGQLHLWSRGEELVTERFPELQSLLAHLPESCVIDGELVVWSETKNRPGGFAQLQKRINRKRISQGLLGETPVRLIAYDLLELAGQDQRSLTLRQRRRHLENLVRQTGQPLLGLSEVIFAVDWQEAENLRLDARARGVEGLMLKHRESVYGIGRTKPDTHGGWLKWKLDPLTIDAVLIYAQKGHGRRANLYSDYTFALWSDPPDNPHRQLVPVAKAYSGLSDEEIRQIDKVIRSTTREKFGPVRSVQPTVVFELGFEAVQRSARHKSGVAVRFPRMLRIRADKPIGEADCLANLQAMAY